MLMPKSGPHPCVDPRSRTYPAILRYVGMNEFEIEEENEHLGIQTNVVYYSVTEKPFGGLIRKAPRPCQTANIPAPTTQQNNF